VFANLGFSFRILYKGALSMSEDHNMQTKPVSDLYNSITSKYIKFLEIDDVRNKDYDLQILDRYAESFVSGSVICDVGCGPKGHIGRYLFDKGLKVWGIDISDNAIKNARVVNPQINFLTMDMRKMSFENETFDGIIAFYSVIHIGKEYLDEVYGELGRVMKKGGKLLLALHKGEGESIFEELWGCKSTYLVKWYTENELKKLLFNNGFTVKFMESRSPYDFEVQTERIYAIAEKK
jgi:SAM-dependent methyltransferase